MKKISLIAIALCFVFLSSFENLAQKKQSSVKQKLVKCRVNGKIVYRTRCRTKKKLKQEVSAETISPITDQSNGIISGGTGQGTGLGNGRGTGQGSGSGQGIGNGSGSVEKENTVKIQVPPIPKPSGETKNVKLLSKPRAVYTDIAKKNLIQGEVILRVMFLENGKIGEISPVKGLADGLTDQAIEAAKNIKFEPAVKNGKPYSKTMIISYSFTLY